VAIEKDDLDVAHCVAEPILRRGTTAPIDDASRDWTRARGGRKSRGKEERSYRQYS
jgi:hypothetical protein